MVSAGFEGDENGSVAGPAPRLGECVHLGVRSSAPGMESLARNLAFGIENHRSHHGVWGGAESTSGGKIEGVPHPVVVHRVDRITVSHRMHRFPRERFPAVRRLSVPSVASGVFDI